MSTKTERNWQLIVAGILFVIFGLVCAFFPGLTLASIAFIVGAAFVVSGVVNIATFIRDRDLLAFRDGSWHTASSTCSLAPCS